MKEAMSQGNNKNLCIDSAQSNEKKVHWKSVKTLGCHSHICKACHNACTEEKMLWRNGQCCLWETSYPDKTSQWNSGKLEKVQQPHAWLQMSPIVKNTKPPFPHETSLTMLQLPFCWFVIEDHNFSFHCLWNKQLAKPLSSFQGKQKHWGQTQKETMQRFQMAMPSDFHWNFENLRECAEVPNNNQKFNFRWFYKNFFSKLN